MPSGRHRATRQRPSWLPRTLAAIAVGAIAVPGLSAGAAPTPAPTVSTLTALDGVAAAALDGRGEPAADRSYAREDIVPAAPRAASDPAPEPLPEVTGQLWASSAVNVRSAPSMDGEVLTTLEWAETVDVTGETADDWSQVIWDERVAWVSSSYLVDSEPVAEPVEEEADPAPSGVSSAACATSPGIEASLAANAAAVYRAVCAAFPGTASAYGGYRAGDGGDHGSGRAVDIMVSGQAGWDIAAYLQAHAGELGIKYLIYQQQIWMAGSSAGAWEYMADRGSATANHYDHVHVSTY